MADSDNTTPLSFVTRRTVLGTTAIAILGWEKSALAGQAPAATLPSDPALAIWREWRNAHEESERLCDQSAHLERTLVETVGCSSATQPADIPSRQLRRQPTLKTLCIRRVGIRFR
ncbi:hypothetical protein NKH54_26600 [Mesorhizobium sp. M1004]|uniref:hypothetical protein n=1 Tax=Mesorhizobium sp. M1004 TaxID=2957046 RepID=UPI003337F814